MKYLIATLLTMVLCGCGHARPPSAVPFESSAPEQLTRNLLPEVENLVIVFPRRLSTSPFAEVLRSGPDDAMSWLADVDRTSTACGLDPREIESIVLAEVGAEWMVSIDAPRYFEGESGAVDQRLGCLAAGLRILTLGGLAPTLDDDVIRIQPGTRTHVEWLPTYGVLRVTTDRRMVLYTPALELRVQQLLAGSDLRHAPPEILEPLTRTRNPCVFAKIGDFESTDSESPFQSVSLTVSCSEAETFPVHFEALMTKPELAVRMLDVVKGVVAELWPGQAENIGLDTRESWVIAEAELATADFAKLVDLALMTI